MTHDMRLTHLALRGLSYYWRTNAAVVLGVATAVAVLAGALLVGDSVRGSLRDLVLQRLGHTDLAVVSSAFFRERFAEDLRADESFSSSFSAICPLIVVRGLVSEQISGRRASRVQVYGVDDRFWRFHNLPAIRGPEGREALVSVALASEIGAHPGATILARFQRPSAVPLESLHGRKDDLGQTIRLTVRAVIGAEALGEFSLQPQQGEVRAVFMPMSRLQQDLGVNGHANALLVSKGVAAASGDGIGALETLIRHRAKLEDLGLELTVVESQGVLAIESDAGLIDEPRAHAINEALAGQAVQPVLTYLANSLRRANREVPYSLVTATDLRKVATHLASQPDAPGPPPMVLNEWAARDLRAKTGDPVSLEYYVWEEPGRLLTRTADFRVAGIVPIAGPAADRDLAPDYPGITEALSVGDWDPPFPIDLRRVRPVDEHYWDQYRTTPKAFIPLTVGQELWRSRYGALTSLRLTPGQGQSLTGARDRVDERLRAALDPVALGLIVRDVRAEGMAASRGATDFAAYFTYFSVFLVVSALLLAALFFKLGIEHRAREVGLLRAVGFSTADVRRLFMAEGLVLSLIGGILGMAGAVSYGYLLMTGLRTWWVDAVGTNALVLHVSWASLAGGAGGGILAAMACIWWTLRGISRVSERSLLADRIVGDRLTPAGRPGRARPLLVAAMGCGVLGLALVAAAMAGLADRTRAFFGSGTALLVSSLFLIAWTLRRPTRVQLGGYGWWPVSRLGVRNAAYRPGRSVLLVAVMASASFVLTSVDAFRRDDKIAADRHSGLGGYSLLVEFLLPFVHDPNTPDGRDWLGLSEPVGRVEPFRVLPGDDASCLNLYEPKNPRILAPRPGFIGLARFGFQRSLATTEAERANPWLLLDRNLGTDVVPVIADANSMTYVLHRKLGDELILNRGGRPVRLRFVAALDDSIFQSELLMSEANFLRLFPDQEGYSLVLLEAAPERVAAVAAAIEARLADLGADAVPTAERLAGFHQVENTYLDRKSVV